MSRKRARTDAPARYIFLDIDGVLNCAPSRAAAARLEEEKQTLMLAGAPSLLANLKYIVDQTGASIVLSSTWRVEEATKDAVATRLSSVGLKLVGCTPELIELEPPDSHATLCEGPDGDFLFGRERAIEILRWLKAEGAADADFVALDDMDLHGPAGVGLHARNFVRTEDMYGLTRLRAETAVARFFALESQRHAAARQGAAAPSVEGDECLCASRRFDFRPPSGERDEAVHALFNDEETMLPYLPMLCPMSRSALERRRAEQRLGMARGTSCFMDILDRTSGELVCTAGSDRSWRGTPSLASSCTASGSAPACAARASSPTPCTPPRRSTAP